MPLVLSYMESYRSFTIGFCSSTGCDTPLKDDIVTFDILIYIYIIGIIYLFFSWVLPFFLKGRLERLETIDVPQTRPQDTTKIVMERLAQ